MEIKNMKCKRPGKHPVSFGGCHSRKATKRYAELEGFVVGSASCCKCFHKWDMIIPPEKLPLKLIKGIQAFTLPEQPCINCDTKRVILTVNFKP